MTERDETAREGDTGGHPSALSAAVLRIGASLDLDTVLREVVETARALTGAGCGATATVDELGRPGDFVTSGLTEDEHRALEGWPDGHGLFAHLAGLAAPLRLADLAEFVNALVPTPCPIDCGAFQGTPMRHRGVHVGSFFLGTKAGGFTDADEEVLVLLAAQAAAAVANARAHREERRARAGLEALVETCPVGVVVLDAATGALASLNREARRITAGLVSPELPVERLAGAMTCRRGDGRAVTLDDLGRGETIRAEEVELSVPGGASVRTLLDATPIRAEDGAVERLVVILQDLEPFEALARSRADFLSTVSHELRTPLAAIKGSAATALEGAREPDRAELRQFLRIVGEQADRMDGLIGDLLDAGRIGAGLIAVDPEPGELAGLVERARTAFTGAGGRHAVTVDLAPDLPRVMADPRRVVQVLDNLLTNAARHSPAASPIRVAAEQDGAHVAVSVADSGEGVPSERLPHLFRRHGGIDRGEGGASGLGLVICRGLVEAHGGRIRAESAGPGRGTTITFTLPAAEEAPAAAVPASASPEGRGRTPVLVVDDDPHALRQMRDALAAAGYEPATAAEPGGVSRLIETRHPALAVLDLVLPGADGIELMRTLPALADLPVIFVSAYGRGETIAQALEAGAADYIVKPFSPAELVARVGVALNRHGCVCGKVSRHHRRQRRSVSTGTPHCRATASSRTSPVRTSALVTTNSGATRKRRPKLRLRGERPLQRANDAAVAAHFEIPCLPIHRCEQLRRQVNGVAHDGWNMNLFESVQRMSLCTFRMLSPAATRPGSTTFALIPRRQSLFPRREFANFIASTPNRAANFRHPRCGTAVTSMIAVPNANRVPAGRFSLPRPRSTKS